MLKNVIFIELFCFLKILHPCSNIVTTITFMIKIHVVELMKSPRFFLERELRENESKVARFHALIDYKCRK